MNNPVIYQRDTATGNFGNPDNFLPVANHQLYARILRLSHLDHHVSMAIDGPKLREIVAEVIYSDRTLVWC